MFACLFLDNRHRIIGFEKLFFGTIDATSVYPRVVVQRALENNAGGHAHAQPSVGEYRTDVRLDP
ncbi:MAG: JAB domain-containing protein [Methylococcales bacterium]